MFTSVLLSGLTAVGLAVGAPPGVAPSANRSAGTRTARAAAPAHPAARPAHVDLEAFRRAIKSRESRGERHPYRAWGDYLDRKRRLHPQSWGAYQCKRARWCEGGGRPSEWGHADPARQDQVMRQLARRYARDAARQGCISEKALVRRMARIHNGLSPASIPYAADIWRWYVREKARRLAVGSR